MADAGSGKVAEPPGVVRIPCTPLPKYISSPPPNTCGWLARICSTSVEPDRIIPTMNTGTEDGLPTFCHVRINSEVNTSGHDPTLQAFGFVIHNLPALEGIAVQPLAERFRVAAHVLIGLAQSEMQFDPVADGKRGAVPGQLFHRRQMRVPSNEPRDVGQIASVLGVVWCQLDGLFQSRTGFRQAARVASVPRQGCYGPRHSPAAL